jgi:hypothetical protein
MNERIQELCKRAGFIGEGFQNTVIGTCQETALENLAELIVRECADIAAINSHYGISVGRIVKEHFGVES